KDIKAVVGKLVRMVVEDGSLDAARLLLSYTIGPPLTYNVNPDDMDLAELEKLRSQAQPDSLDNPRLSPQAALIIAKTYQALCSAATIGDEMYDNDGSFKPQLLAELERAGLSELSQAAQKYLAGVEAYDATLKAAHPKEDATASCGSPSVGSSSSTW